MLTYTFTDNLIKTCIMQAIVIIIQLDGLESLNNLVFIIEKVKLNGKNASMVILCFVQDLQKICF